MTIENNMTPSDAKPGATWGAYILGADGWCRLNYKYKNNDMTKNYHYYLDRGDTMSARGYQAFLTDGDKQLQVRIDDMLKVKPKDTNLLALRREAVAAISLCIKKHGPFHVIKADKGTNQPKAYNVFCDPARGGCGNQYVTCDPTGKSAVAPCPVTGGKK